MSLDDRLKKVEELLQKGYGRRRIAPILGTSEWETRILINAVLAKAQLPAQKKVDTVKRSLAETLVEVKTNKKTDIVIKSNSEVNEYPTKISIRPINQKVMCVSDIHYPYENIKAEDLALSFAKEYKPDIIVWNGDIFDCYAVSSYNKDVSKKMNIQDEIDYGVSRMTHWVKSLPSTKHYFLEGNHETRLARMISGSAPALAALRSTKFEEVVGLYKIGIEYVKSHQDLFIGSLMFYHGDAVRKGAGNSVRAHFDQYGCSIIMGHCHRLSVGHKRNKYGTHTLIENGTLASFDVEYARFPDWQTGFTVIEYDGDSFVPYSLPIINDKLIAFGKVYG